MDLLVDTFAQQLAQRIVPAGWVITDYSRYEPTHVAGVTPTGKAFTLDITKGGLATITVAGNIRSQQLTGKWQEGEATVDAWLAVYQLLPVNQR